MRRRFFKTMELWKIYLILCNAGSFFLCAVDKVRAKQNRWRVPEGTLFLLAALGGSTGLLLGMLLLRHKTKHLQFMLGVPLILLAQAAIWYFLIK